MCECKATAPSLLVKVYVSVRQRHLWSLAMLLDPLSHFGFECLHTQTSSQYTAHTDLQSIHAVLARIQGSFRTASGAFGRIQVCLFVEHMALLVENRALLVGHTVLLVEHRGLLVDFSFLEHGALLLEHRALLAEYRALYARTMLWNTCTHNACAYLMFFWGVRTQKCRLRCTRTR